jgi:hypothetical protein
MTDDLSQQQIDDLQAVTIALMWDKLPKNARQGIESTMSPNDRNDVALAIRQGKRVIRANQQKSK